MKKVFGVIIFIIFCIQSWAQSDIKPGWANLDYSVPESPALKILGVNPDNVLKPTSVRKVALSVGNYFITNGPIIPKNLAVEFSPLLLNSKCSLNDYNKSKFLYRARISIGTNSGNKGSYSVSEGVRFTIFDKTDLRTNSQYLSDIDNSLGASVSAEDKAIKEYASDKSNHMTEIETRTKFEADPAFQNKILALETKFIPDNIVKPGDMEKLRDKYRESLWNKPIWEIGIAALQVSQDSLVNNLKTSQFAFWSSTGLPIGKKGQLLIGGKAAIVDSISWKTNASIGARFYYGSNEVQGFIQGQFDYKETGNSFVGSLGCFFNITNGLWGQFSFNLVIAKDGKISYQPGFNIGFGTPEKAKK